MIEGEEQTTWFVWLVVCCCTISVWLSYRSYFWCPRDNQGRSGTIYSLEWTEGVITFATTLGALLGGLTAGIISDWTGRRLVLGIADVIFICGAIGQAACHTVWSMIGCRFLIGIGVGLASCMALLYILELAPTRFRGRMVVLNNVMVTFGQVVAYGIVAGFANVSGRWRWMVGLSAVPAVLQAVILIFLPESSRILVRRGNMEAAYATLSRVYATATPEQVQSKLEVLHAAVRQSIEIANSTAFWQRFVSMFLVQTNRRATIVACGMLAFQQLCGFNTLMYYSASLFQEIDFNRPTAVRLIVSGTNFLFTLVALKYIDIVGRRKIMLYSAPGMIFGLTLAAIAFHFMTKHTGNVLVTGAHYSHAWSAIVLVSVILFVAFFASRLGSVPWQQGEFFPLEVRGIDTSLGTATCWAANLIINSTYLSLMAEITPSGAFGFYAGLCLLGFLFCVCCFPETAGLSLEEVKWILQDGFGVQQSKQLREMKRSIVGAQPVVV